MGAGCGDRDRGSRGEDCRGGVAPGPGSLPAMAITTTPTLGKSQIEGKKPGTVLPPDIGRVHTRALHAQKYTDTHTCT